MTGLANRRGVSIKYPYSVTWCELLTSRANSNFSPQADNRRAVVSSRRWSIDWGSRPQYSAPSNYRGRVLNVHVISNEIMHGKEGWALLAIRLLMSYSEGREREALVRARLGEWEYSAWVEWGLNVLKYTRPIWLSFTIRKFKAPNFWSSVLFVIPKHLITQIYYPVVVNVWDELLPSSM